MMDAILLHACPRSGAAGERAVVLSGRAFCGSTLCSGKPRTTKPTDNGLKHVVSCWCQDVAPSPDSVSLVFTDRAARQKCLGLSSSRLACDWGASWSNLGRIHTSALVLVVGLEMLASLEGSISYR